LQLVLLGWAPRATQPTRIALRVSFDGGTNEFGKLAYLPNGDLDVFGFGEIPIEAKAKDGFATDKLHATLRLRGGRWKVIEQKPADWHPDPAPAKPAEVAALEADQRFSLADSFRAPDGSWWAIGRMGEGGPALLLHDRPAKDVWHASDAKLVEVPDELIPNCTPITFPSRPARP
jgi:hypothetical protein